MDGSNWEDAFRKVAEAARALKEEALNRHDRDFDPWYRQARNVLLRYCPVKIPAYDEIRFASDFFLMKKGEDQLEINDRIALACDIDLALEIFEQAKEVVAEELRRQKSRSRIGGGASIEPPKPATQEAKSGVEPAEGNSDPLLDLVATMDLTRREKEEAEEEIERVITLLKKPEPDWDRIKRTLKFLLDFDKHLALDAVPEILERYKQQNRR